MRLYTLSSSTFSCNLYHICGVQYYSKLGSIDKTASSRSQVDRHNWSPLSFIGSSDGHSFVRDSVILYASSKLVFSSFGSHLWELLSSLEVPRELRWPDKGMFCTQGRLWMALSLSKRNINCSIQASVSVWAKWEEVAMRMLIHQIPMAHIQKDQAIYKREYLILEIIWSMLKLSMLLLRARQGSLWNIFNNMRCLWKEVPCLESQSMTNRAPKFAIQPGCRNAQQQRR